MSNLITDEQFSMLCEHLKQECEFEEMSEVVNVGKELKVKREPIWKCDHTLSHTVAWMDAHGVQDIRANVDIIARLGGHCDCKVLFNTATYWNKRENEEVMNTFDPENWVTLDEWTQFIDHLMAISS